MKVRDNNNHSSDDGNNNSWDNGLIDGGNYWCGYVCEGNPSNGSQPYYIPGSANAVDTFPFQDKNGWLNETAFGVDLSSDSTTKSISSGGSATYNITVTNTGIMSDTINLQLPPPADCGWSEWLDNYSVELSPSESTEVALTVSDVVGHPSGVYWGVKVTGTSQGDPSKYDFIITNTTIEKIVFDTGVGTYPSISGTHNGTLKLNQPLTVQNLYTYPCAGTGGHPEYAKIYVTTHPLRSYYG